MLKVKLVKNHNYHTIDIHVFYEDHKGNRFFAKPVDIVIDNENPHKPGSVIQPFAQINSDAFETAVETDMHTFLKNC